MATLADFIASNGGEAVREGRTSWFVCVSGAKYYLMDDNVHIEFREAPVDSLANAQARLRFVEEKLAREEEEFRRYKENCVQQANWHEQNPSSCPPAPANATEVLQAGKNRITELRQQARDLERQIAKHPRSKQRAAAQREQRAAMGLAQQRLSEIESVTLED